MKQRKGRLYRKGLFSVDRNDGSEIKNDSLEKYRYL
jgi:hypothetical protein